MPAAPPFQKIDYRYGSLKEFFTDSRSWQVVVGVILVKVFRLSVAGSTDDLPVESLQPFEAQSIPEEMRNSLEPLAREMVDLSFHSPVCYFIDDTLNHTKTVLISYLHPTGVVGRIHLRHWLTPTKPKIKLFAELITPTSNGGYLWTLSGKLDTISPQSCLIQRHIDATPAQLLKYHLAALPAQSPILVSDHQGLMNAQDGLQKQLFDFHTRRGIFRPAKPAEAEAALRAQNVALPTNANADHLPVLREIDLIENRKSSRVAGIWMLIISIVLFLTIGKGRWTWPEFLLLIPILLFHELGHFAAMRLFGYKDLKIFFIPLLGAAVTGRNYNISGWKKAVVALMGPLPGIFVGIILGIVGYFLHHKTLLQISQLTLIINTFNLLPLMPLDGGRVMQAVLFSRSYVWDVCFQIIAAILLILIGFFSSFTLSVLGILLLIGIPQKLKLGKAAQELRQLQAGSPTSDSPTVPPELAAKIIDKIRTAKPLPNKILAQQTLAVYETLNAHPPGILASLSLIAVQGAAFFVSFGFVIFLLVMQMPAMDAFLYGDSSAEMTHPLSPDNHLHWKGSAFQPDLAAHRAVIATFDQRAPAITAFAQIIPSLPQTASVMGFGDSIIVTFPSTGVDDSAAILNKLETSTQNVYIEYSDQFSYFKLTAVAPDDSIATDTSDELAESLRFANNHADLIQPWHVDHGATAAQYAAYRKARQTGMAVTKSAESTIGDPELLQLQRSIADARRRGDPAVADSLTRQRADLMRDIIHNALTELRSQPNMDPAIIDAYLKTPATQPVDLIAHPVPTDAEPLFGRLSNDLLLGPAGQLTAGGGFAFSNKRTVHLAIYLSDLAKGGPAIIDWLAERGFTDFHYELQGAQSNNLDSEP